MHKTIPDYENCSEENKILYVIMNEGFSEEVDLSYDLSDKRHVCEGVEEVFFR